MIVHLLVAFATPPEIVRGDDLGRWVEIHQAALDEAQKAEAYRDFLSTFPESPLAEVACARLDDADCPELVLRSREAHARTLARGTGWMAVASLDAAGVPQPAGVSPWSVSAHLGGGWNQTTFVGSVGVDVRYAPIGIVARLGRGASWHVEGGVRAVSPGRLAPWGELTLDSVGRVNAIGGGRFHLGEMIWIEAGGGVGGSDRLYPVARIEWVYGA